MVTLAQKKDRIVQLTDQVARSKVAVVSDYRGLSVKELTDLRRKIQDAGGELTVAKNTLIRRAINDTEGMPAIDDILQGPTALMVGYEDPVAPVKAMIDFLKENKKKQEIRGGIINGRAVEPDELEKIAKLPSREEMIAKLMGSMQSPAQGVAITMSGVARNLVYVLEAVRAQKENS